MLSGWLLHKGECHQDAPRMLKPREACLEPQKVIEESHPHTHHQEEHESQQHVPQAHRMEVLKREEQNNCCCRDQDSRLQTHIAPELENNHPHSIQTAPNDEVHAGSMPQTAQEHGYHTVEIGVNLPSSIRTIDSCQNGCGKDNEYNGSNPPTA